MKTFPYWWPLLAALTVTGAALVAGHARGLPSAQLLASTGGVLLLLYGYFALSDARIRSRLSVWLAGSRARTILAGLGLLLPYLAYSLPLGVFSAAGLLALVLYITLPLLFLLPRPSGGHSRLAEMCAALLLWLPIELHRLPALWTWPPGQQGHYLDGLFGVILAVYAFQVVRALPGIGFSFVPRSNDWLLAAGGFLLFLPLALGLGYFTGFLRPALHPLSPPSALARILGIFLITAMPEELLFRGLLQNLLLRWTGRPILSLGFAALLFGAAHLNVGSHPDWRLALLATLAGVLYGGLYQLGSGLMAPALAHTFVNAFWTLLFRR